MKTPEFRKWLADEYLQRNGKPLAPGTQVSRSANCSTIEQYEGNLDAHFDRDGLAALLRKLSYSNEDRERGLKPAHRIPINGDAVNGSTTYRSAIQLYRKYRVSSLGVVLNHDSPSGDESLLAEVINDSLTRTEREALVKSRVGQGRFRSLVLEVWDYRCAVTGSGILLAASHIKPWRASTNTERLDAWNGLALSPTFDRAFDAGLITFSEDGKMSLSPRLPIIEAMRLGIKASLHLTGLHRKHAPYLSFHRETVFRR